MMPARAPKLLRNLVAVPIQALLMLVLVLGAFGEAQAQFALPIDAANVTLTAPGVVVVPIDLGTIPNRPQLHIEVVPDNPLVELEIEVSNWAGLSECVGDPGQTWQGSYRTFVSTPTVGANSLVVDLRSCEPRVPSGFWDNGTVDVTIRVLAWGSRIQKADVDVSIYGVTVIPTSERLVAVDTTPSPISVSFTPDRDTVIYGYTQTASNGFGDYLWAGQDYRLIGQPPFLLPTRYRINSLLAFDELLVDIPLGSVVTSAFVELHATSVIGGGGTVSLHDIAPAASGEAWLEGNANASGSEFLGTTSPTLAADWVHRRGFLDPWMTQGGDLISPALSSRFIASTGARVFTGSAISASIQDVVDSREAHEGFLLNGPGNFLSSTDIAVQFASRNGPNFIERPKLVVEFTPPVNFGAGSSESLTTGTVTYIGEGENFRWIYDTDGDDLLYTPVGGVCEALEQEFPDGTVAPYNYSYQGSPGFVGTDCCAWLIDAPQTGVVGTGQAIFFHNLDPSNPSNLPPDTDGDGMRDGCDNCVNVPNGPYLGTCVGIGGAGGLCTADTDCGQFEFCSQSQEDIDFDQAGDACSVPEPGFATLLGVSVGWLAAAAGRRRQRCAGRPQDDKGKCHPC